MNSPLQNMDLSTKGNNNEITCSEKQIPKNSFNNITVGDFS